MTAAQRMLIGTALGKDTLWAAERLQFCLLSYGKADAQLWREFLEAILSGPGAELLSTPLGMTLQWAILAKIRGHDDGNDSASERRPKPASGAGFPRRQ